MQEFGFRTVSASCTANLVPSVFTFDPYPVIAEFKIYLSKLLFKKGIQILWVEESARPDLYIRYTEVNEGNQLLRIFIPFSAPAIIKADVHLRGADSTVTLYRITARMHLGLLGGWSKHMIRACAGKLAKKIVCDVFKFGRGSLILTLGIISLLTFNWPIVPFLVGIFAIYIGVEDLVEINNGNISRTALLTTLAGTVLSLIGILCASSLLTF